MAEYIDREKMLKYLEENNTADEWIVNQYNADWIYSFVENQPTADVVEVKHGEWIEALYDGKPYQDEDYNYVNRCSICDMHILGNDYNYCPKCGAKMDGKNAKERERE